MNPDNLNLPPDLLWRQKLMREELNARDLLLIEDQLGLRLYGFRKPGESIVGFRVLYEDEGLADLLLMRRDFTDPGFFFDLDGTLGKVTAEESEELHHQVHRTIDTLTADLGAVGQNTEAAPRHREGVINYWLQMAGDQASNEAFLARLKSLPVVEDQTRFIASSPDGLVQIAVWSSEPLEAEFRSLASETDTSIVGIIRQQ
jgi:hypothetical protein